MVRRQRRHSPTQVVLMSAITTTSPPATSKAASTITSASSGTWLPVTASPVRWPVRRSRSTEPGERRSEVMLTRNGFVLIGSVQRTDRSLQHLRQAWARDTGGSEPILVEEPAVARPVAAVFLAEAEGARLGGRQG